MGATTRYGLRYPASSAAVTIWMWVQNLADDVEARLGAVEDAAVKKADALASRFATASGNARMEADGTIATNGNVVAANVQGGRVYTTSAFCFGAVGVNDCLVLGSEGSTTLQVLNPGASLWATVKAGAFAVQSTLASKANVTSRAGTDELDRMRVVDFVYKEDPDTPRVGFIAEELASVFPGAVTYTDGGAPDGVDLSKLVPLLVLRVQQLNDEVALLQAFASKP